MSISSFYLVAQRTLRPKTWWRTFFYLPFVMAVGIGLAVRNSIAVLQALAGHQSEFARTPKYRIEGKGRSAPAEVTSVSEIRDSTSSWVKKAYKNPSGWTPFAEVALGVYFAATVVYSFQNENYVTIPFLLLFVGGYLYTGLMSLFQTYLTKLRFAGEIPESRPASAGAPSF